MYKKIEILNAAAILLLTVGVSANTSSVEKRKPATNEFDVNSIVLLEEEVEIDLGFDTKKYLPENFNPYAYPQDVKGFNYIDENDNVEIDFDTKAYLPEGFDAYKK